jgi:DNA recombination protein RmuC
MEIAYLLIGIVAGAAIGYLLAWMMSQKKASNVVSLEPVVAELRAQNSLLQSQLNERRTEAVALKTDLDNSRIQVADASAQIARLEEQIQARKQAEEAFRQDIADMKQRMSLEFGQAAQKILEDSTLKLDSRNKESLEQMINPLKENLTRLQDRFIEEEKGRVELKAQIVSLTDLNQKMRAETENLSNALKGDNKMQGNWGELMLEKLLENSGLTEGIEFETQHSTTNEDGSRILPDVIIRLPEDKHLIIDSKVSLVDYQRYTEAQTEAEKQAAQSAHVQSVRTHIKGLAEKNYPSGKGLSSPDFVLLFIPIESCFALALKSDPNLYQFALEKNIVLVSPTTLLATLRTIHHMWRQEKQNRNTQKIAEEAGKLLDSFRLFGEEMQKLENYLQKSHDHYFLMKKKMSEGNGNLLKRIETIQKLGVKAPKGLPDILKSQDSEEDTDTEDTLL